MSNHPKEYITNNNIEIPPLLWAVVKRIKLHLDLSPMKKMGRARNNVFVTSLHETTEILGAALKVLLYNIKEEGMHPSSLYTLTLAVPISHSFIHASAQPLFFSPMYLSTKFKSLLCAK
jgi:hypothetical protein